MWMKNTQLHYKINGDNGWDAGKWNSNNRTFWPPTDPVDPVSKPTSRKVCEQIWVQSSTCSNGAVQKLLRLKLGCFWRNLFEDSNCSNLRRCSWRIWLIWFLNIKTHIQSNQIRSYIWRPERRSTITVSRIDSESDRKNITGWILFIGMYRTLIYVCGCILDQSVIYVSFWPIIRVNL